MAKIKELKPLRKGVSNFTLIGKAKVKDYTFTIDAESAKENSDWIYNSMNLGVNCGQSGDIYCELFGGYGSTRENVLYVHGKKINDNGQEVDDYETQYTIAWEDRFDEDILSNIGKSCFLTVGLEKDESDKTIYKDFLSPYDAISYIKDNLKEDMIINVKGRIEYNEYKARKIVKSLVLSRATEEDFKATFVQSILLDSNSVGKIDTETRTVPITCCILERLTEFNDMPIEYVVRGKKRKGTILPMNKVLSFEVGEDISQVEKKTKIFKVRGKKYTQLTVEGIFTRGQMNTVEVTEADIPEDIRELIDLGLYEAEEILGQIALKNGTKKPEVMIIKAPHLIFNTKGETRLPAIDKEIDIYEETDLDIYSILNNLGVKTEEIEEQKEVEEEEEEIDLEELDDELDALLGEME